MNAKQKECYQILGSAAFARITERAKSKASESPLDPDVFSRQKRKQVKRVACRLAFFQTIYLHNWMMGNRYAKF